MITLRGVVARAGSEVVLRDVDLVVRAGECCALVGTSGSGKTTLLRVCATLLRPSAGTVEIGGVDALRRPRAARARLGYAPQRSGAVDGMTAREELEVAAACHGIAPARRRRIASDLLELTALTSVADADVGRLSPGLHRRLLLARALVHDPAVLLLDAPDAWLDDAACAEVAALLGELRDMGKAILVAGSGPLVAGVCDTVVVLDGGRVRWRESSGEAAAGVPA